MATKPFSLLLLLTSLFLFLSRLSPSSADSHFEGFDAEYDDDDLDDPSSLPLQSQPKITKITPHHPPTTSDSPNPPPPSTSDPPKTTPVDFWDEDEFEGLPTQSPTSDKSNTPSQYINPTQDNNSINTTDPNVPNSPPPQKRSFTIEIICGSFLIMFAINYFSGKRENENIALSWAAQFATKDSIFDKNFSLLGIGEGGEDTPLLLKEGQTVFKFYASGRRYCQGLLATMELKSRQDLISRLYNMVVPCRDEISFEVFMNEECMDHVVFALARKKAAKGMQKDERDLQRFANVVSVAPGGRKWVADELAVISESKEVAAELITDTVLDQVFGDKAYEKFGKGFISMHFSDQHPGIHKKVLLFKFVLPDAKKMADMTRLVALVPYYIDLIGRLKLSSQARSKTEAARHKAAQELQKELQNARQEALQRKKAERRKMLEEAEAKLGAEAIRKKEAKDRARQMKKAMPKIKMSRAG